LLCQEIAHGKIMAVRGDRLQPRIGWNRKNVHVRIVLATAFA